MSVMTYRFKAERRVIEYLKDDENIRTLKCKYDPIGLALDQLSDENHGTLVQIEKMLGAKYCRLEENLKNNFRNYMEILEAPLDEREGKVDNFKEAYGYNQGDQNLYTLYDSIMGKPELFNQPILEVYLKHSRGDVRTMESLCDRVIYLICIGLTAEILYGAIVGDNKELLINEWTDRLDQVLEKMDKALLRCH